MRGRRGAVVYIHKKHSNHPRLDTVMDLRGGPDRRALAGYQAHYLLRLLHLPAAHFRHFEKSYLLLLYLEKYLLIQDIQKALYFLQLLKNQERRCP